MKAHWTPATAYRYALLVYSWQKTMKEWLEMTDADMTQFMSEATATIGRLTKAEQREIAVMAYELMAAEESRAEEDSPKR